MKDPGGRKVGEDVMSRHDVEVLAREARKHGALLLRLKEAILSGDAVEEHTLARELCGLPKEAEQ